MTWGALIGLGLAAYALKAVGPLLAGHRPVRPGAAQVLELVAPALLAGLIMVQTFGGDHRIVLDARAPALGVAALLVWRRAPFLVVVLCAAATAALLRSLG
ncbi:MAG TPA: AzlD domain-containing protein [Solirubrobacteraceae bacterium]|nr:AzlD domain-containing protein [Solirubrobacteraceae bacterium]